MRVVINTPSGNLGHRVVDQLLTARHDVVIISRHPDKVAPAMARGAALVSGSIDEEAVLDRALRGADALFWVTPITFEPADYMAWARLVGRNAAAVARRHDVRRAVVISSIGAQHEDAVGPVGCNVAIEQAFTNAVPNLTILRPASFMENLLQHVPTIAGTGTIYTRYPQSLGIPWIATRDIADRAVAALTDTGWTGPHVLELQGPEDLDQTQLAAIVGEAIVRQVTSIEVTDEQAKQGMLSAGMPASFAQLLLEMYAAVASGRMKRTQPRSPLTSTPTSLFTFAREVLKPAVDAAPTI